METPLQGRRRLDLEADGAVDRELASLQHGDYWRVLKGRYVEIAEAEPSNLEHTAWGYYLEGFGVGFLAKHTVREHEDGTISVLPNDGSSNSILCRKRADEEFFHGYIRRGVWVDA
jgi:hypothetical protein